MNVLLKAPDNPRDVLLFLPVLKRLKLHYEAVHVTVLANMKAREILSLVDDYNEVIPYQAGVGKFLKTFFYLKKHLPKIHYDYFISFDTRWDLALFAFFKRVHTRIVDGSSLFNFFAFSHRESQDRDYAIKHEVSYNLDLLEELNLPEYDKQKLIIELKLEEADLKEAKEELAEKFQNIHYDQLVFVHANPGKDYPHWSSRNLARMIKRLQLKHPGDWCFVFYLDDTSEKYLKSFYDEFSKDEYRVYQDRVVYIKESDINFRQASSILKSCDLFVGHNTEWLHLASMFRLSSVGLFNPIRKTSAMRLKPFNSDQSRVKIALPDVVCGELETCSKRACPYFDCMSKLVVKQVCSEVISSLGLDQIEENKG